MKIVLIYKIVKEYIVLELRFSISIYMYIIGRFKDMEYIFFFYFSKNVIVQEKHFFYFDR